MAERTDDERAHDDADETLAEQTPVYPVTKLTRREGPGIGIIPTPEGYRVKLSQVQVRTLYEAYDLLDYIERHATDGVQERASVAMSKFYAVLACYPVEVVEPKKPKPK